MYKDRLKELRTLELITQNDLAKFIGVKQNAYSEYENEYKIIPLKHLISLCDLFDISVDYIFNFSNVKQYKNSKKNINNIEVGKRLKEFRKENKLTQEKLASLLNTNRSVIANYERGRNIIAAPFLYTICKKYKISADYLLGKTEDPKYLK